MLMPAPAVFMVNVMRRKGFEFWFCSNARNFSAPASRGSTPARLPARNSPSPARSCSYAAGEPAAVAARGRPRPAQSPHRPEVKKKPASGRYSISASTDAWQAVVMTILPCPGPGMQHAIDKAERQKSAARFGRIFRHGFQQHAHLLINFPLPEDAFHHHLRPCLPQPERAANR